VLTYTAATTSSPIVGAAYLFTYSLGVGLPLIAVSLATDRLVPWLKKLNRHLPKFEKVTGAAMLVVGAWLVVPALIQPATAAGEGGPGPVDARGNTIEPAIGAAAERPRIVELSTDHCPVCERMKPRLAQLREDCVGHRVEILEVNVNDPRNRELVQQHTVGAVPAVFLFDTAGTQTDTLYGELQLSELRRAAASLILGSCGGEDAPERLDTRTEAPSCSVAASATSVPSTREPETECSDPTEPD
jgi:cytochrome c-type biogenesis protein